MYEEGSHKEFDPSIMSLREDSKEEVVFKVE